MKVSGLNSNRIGAINWLSTNGITVGSGSSNGDTTYKPQDSVNRGAMAQFMHKLAYKVGSTSVVPK
ncbi:MAG: S-layer homology domain-containing protein [Bifidobacteriaceae bacterium]|nr:S-layer homology domain-containing protein [Bifidobacteriaceae bacterium]